MMTEKIKACPYCGSEEVSITSTWGKYYGKCNGCGACGPEAHNYTDAVLLWNAAANALEQKDAEIEKLNKIQHQLNAEIERQKLAYSHWYYKCHEAIAERDELKAALADAQDKRDKYYADWYAEHCRVEAGKRRQDELEAEIAHLTAACDDLEGEYLRMKDERDELEAEIARLTAACDDLEGEYLRMKEHSENLMLRINQLEEYKEIWYKRAMESLDQRDKALVTRDAAVSKISEMRTMWIDDVKRLQDRNGILLNQRDEARKVARVWYNVAGVWKEKAEANDIDKIEDELMKYCKQQQARKVIYWVDGTNETTRTEPQTIRVETTDKETP